MQIYYTDKDPAKCAANLPDQLTYSTLKEIVQIWSKFLHQKGLDAPYKEIAQGQHYVDWMNSDERNIFWIWEYCRELQDNYGKSFNQKVKLLSSYKRAIECLNNTSLETKWSRTPVCTTPPEVYVKDFHPHEFCMCTDKSWENMTTLERNRFYLNWKVNQFKADGKSFRLYTWTNRETPAFIELD